MNSVKTCMVVGLCGFLVAHSDTYADNHHVIKARREQSFWQKYGDIIKQGVPWVVAVAGILHYRDVASKAKIEGVRGVYEHLGNGKNGFAEYVLKGQSDQTKIPVKTNPCPDGGVPTYRLCRDFVENSYTYYCQLLGYMQPPKLHFEEVKTS